MRDFKTVVRKAPSDKDAKLKLAECTKIVKRVEFFKAIEVGDEPSAAEGLDLDSMVVDSDYDGALLGKEMTPEFIGDMIERFKVGKKLHKKYVYQIIIAVKTIVYDEPTMVEMEVDEDSQLTVCGDTHGQYISYSLSFSAYSGNQVNTLILWNFSGLTVTLPRSTNIFSTGISLTGVLGLLRLHYCSMRTNGFIHRPFSLIGVITRPMT